MTIKIKNYYSFVDTAVKQWRVEAAPSSVITKVPSPAVGLRGVASLSNKNSLKKIHFEICTQMSVVS